MKYLHLIILGLFLATGCSDISGSGMADFGTSDADKEVLDHFNGKYGDLTESGEPRIVEPMVTSGLVENLPVDKVSKYSSDIDSFNLWFVYDNFAANNPIEIEWTYVTNDRVISTIKTKATGDFGRGSFTLDKELEAWPVGDYKATITGKGKTASVLFSVIEGNTVSESLPWAEMMDDDSADLSGTTASGFVVKKNDCSYEGDWTSNWGDMTFTVTGNDVTAEYTHDQGKIVGKLNGNILVGTWSEAPSYAPSNDAGDVELELNADCTSLAGNWRFGSDGAWNGDWVGTRKTVSSVTPGWYLIGTNDTTEIVDTHDYYDYSVDYEKGNVLTGVTGGDSEELAVRTTWTEPPTYLAADQEIEIIIRKEGIVIATGGLGLDDTSYVGFDMADIELGYGTAGGYDLSDENYGEYLTVGWKDSQGAVKEAVFAGEAPGANAWGGGMRLGVNVKNSQLYGTRYIYEWRE